jgi:short-subunit dehydrogenase
MYSLTTVIRQRTILVTGATAGIGRYLAFEPADVASIAEAREGLS